LLQTGVGACHLLLLKRRVAEGLWFRPKTLNPKP